MKALTISVRTGSGMPTAAARATAWVLHQAVFDLTWTEAVAGAGNHIVGATEEPNVTIVINLTTIPRQEPIAGKLLSRRL